MRSQVMMKSRVDKRKRVCCWTARRILLLGLLAGSGITAHAQTVDAILTVSDGTQARVLHVGLSPGATDGVDARLGETELPPMPPSGVFEARLVGDDIRAPLGQGTYKDYRAGDAAFVGDVVHELRFQRGGGNGIVISWSLPDGIFGKLQDLGTGALINRGISDAGSFAVPDVGIDRLKLTLSYGGGAERADVDIPFLVSDGTHAQQLHVGLDLTASSGLDRGLSEAELPPMPPAGIFEARLIGDDIEVPLGQGTYRDYRNGSDLFEGSMTHEIRFQRVAPEDTVTVSWVLPDDVSGILVDAGGEDLVNREIRGEGSVKVTAPSVDRLRLTLSYEPARSRAAEVNYALIVSDGSEARKLFFGLDPEATDGVDARLGETELPPMPPSGVFEARLVGDDIRAPLGQGTYKDYRAGDAAFVGDVVHELRFQRGGGNGIVISWSLPDGIFGRLQELADGGSINKVVAGTGGVRIDDASVTALKFTVSYGSSLPDAEVSVPITLTQGEVRKELRVGLDPAATDGIDPDLGESELPPMPPSGVFEARLIGDDIDVAGLGLGSYRDYRHGRVLMDTTITHEILIQPAEDEPITLSWNLPENAVGELQDVGGTVVDQQMTGRGDYVLPDADITRLTLTLTYSSGAQGPEVVVDAPETGNSGEDIPIVITAGGDVPPRSASLFYRRGGERQYTRDDYTPDRSSLQATIPAAFVTERGVEYYVSMDLGGRTVTNPAVNPQDDPLRIRVAVSADSLSTPAGQYRMVSIPLDLSEPDFGEVVRDLGDPDRGNWRLSRWRPGPSPPEGTYGEAPDLESAFVPGNAFWLITSDARRISVGAGRSVSTDGAYRLTLQPGWNQIGNPYSFPVSWGDVVSLLPDEVRGNVEPPRAYDGTQYLPPADLLLPWEGYFVYYRGEAGTTADLLIPPLEAQAADKRGRQDQFLAGVSYAVQISAAGTSDGMKDAWNYVGLASDALGGSDPLDFSEAPGIGPHLRLSIVDGSSHLDGDFKPVNGQGQKWDVEIETIQTDGTIPTRVPIKVDLKERGVRPPGFNIYVLDRDRDEYVALTDGHFATLAGGRGAVRHYTVVVGTKAFAEGALGLDPSAPKEFGIDPSYPNPAESDATIRYYVPHTSTVHLQIFDLLGRRVRMLASEEQEPGVMTVHWDTRDDAGVPVASGVYFCRMTADGFSDSIQILVVRR